jgi:hypothetical protein
MVGEYNKGESNRRLESVLKMKEIGQLLEVLESLFMRSLRSTQGRKS